MKRHLPCILLFAVACGPSETDDTPDPEPPITFGDDDDSGTTDTGTRATELPDGEYWGTVPGVEVSAPEFAAINRDNSPRSREDLLGHPTVMWFFPLAGTPG